MKKLVLGTLIIINLFPVGTFAKERLSLGYIYSAPSTYSSLVNSTNGSINVVSPTGLDLSINGKLEVNFSMSQSFVQEMHQKNIQVVPFLSNHWGSVRGKAVLDHPEKVIEDLKNVIVENNLDGVNIDIENIPSEYRDKLTNFVKLVKESLPKEKQVSVAVAANPSRLKDTWLASYDYKALSEYADYLVLMAYDEHGLGGREGPVASIQFVKESLKYMLEEVPRDQVVLGIPLYGRYWKEDAETGGDALTTFFIEKIIKEKKLNPILDKDSMSVCVSFEVLEGEEEDYYGFEAGVYKIWYENETSMTEKLKLINEYNIRGAALWALSQEEKGFWNYYKSALNEKDYESEKDIEKRIRKVAYEKMPISKTKQPEKICKSLPPELVFKTEDVRNEIDLIAKKADDKEEYIWEDKKYYYLTKNQKIMIKTYNTKSHLTVTFVC